MWSGGGGCLNVSEDVGGSGSMWGARGLERSRERDHRIL